MPVNPNKNSGCPDFDEPHWIAVLVTLSHALNLGWCRESNAVPTLWGKGQLEGLYLEPSCHLSRALFPLADFNLYPLAVMKKWKVLVLQSCLTLCNPIGCNLSGSSVHGILQTRILEWVNIPFSRRSSWPRIQTQVSCLAGTFFTVWTTRETLSCSEPQQWV